MNKFLKKLDVDPLKIFSDPERANVRWVEDHTIFLTVHGSRAYGTNTPESDVDLKGVAIPPKEYHYGAFRSFEQAESNHPYDMVIYDLKKFFRLAADCNPNIIELLFTTRDDWVVATPEFEKLYEHRHDFLSAKARYTFGGYANSQLKRIKTHRAWLLNPPTHQPTRNEHGLPKQKKLSATEMGAMKKLLDENVAINKNVMELYHKEQQYQTKLREWKQYQKWKKERNPERAELEAKYGYDCYLDDTEFLTERGWLSYDNVTEQDKLATVRQKTGQIEFQHYFERVKKPYNGEILHFETQDSMCSVTPNHRMLISPVSRNKKNGFSTRYRQNSADWQIKRAHELLDGQLSYFHTRLTTHRTDANPTKSDELLWLIGAYVSEGCVGKRLTGGVPSVLRFTQKETNRQQVFLDVLCERTKMKRYDYFREDKGYNELIYTLADRELAKSIVDWCGEHSEHKRLPPWYTALSTRQANELLKVLVAGDGTERKYSSIYYTKSSQLADDVQALGIIAGRPSKLWGPYKNGIYQVYLGDAETTDTLVATENGHVTREVVSDRHIVCFSVPNEILITRRKGKVAIQGNSKHAMHLVRLLRMCKEILEKGAVRVHRPDAEELKEIRNGKWSYDELIEWANNIEMEIEAAYKKTHLPKVPNRDKLDKLCVELVEAHVT